MIRSVVLFSLLVTLMMASGAEAREYHKYTDRNGVAFWVDDKGQLPPQMPVSYRYVDKNGVVFWEKSLDKIPQEYRSSATQNYGDNETGGTAGKPGTNRQPKVTRITVAGHQALVPVVIKHKKRTVKASMLLDNATPVTTFYSKLADDLHLSKVKVRHKKKTANYATSAAYLAKVDALDLDGRKLRKQEVRVVPHTNFEADGVLGASSLKNYNVSIDFDQQLLRWN